MLPVVVLIGHPNVGKSTLFNRLTCTCDALVANLPGITRDRKYGRVKLEGREFVCVDTGGIDKTRDSMETRVIEQSILAIEEADIVLFIVDAYTGLTPADSIISKYLHSNKKLTFLILNKVDGIDINQAIVDFYSLGFSKIYPISASSGRGVNILLHTVLLPFIDKLNSLVVMDKNVTLTQIKENQKKLDKKIKDKFNLQKTPIKLAIVGRPNVGKSTLINYILSEKRMVVHEMPGTTHDSIYIPMKRDEHKYVLIDTAGVRKRSKITNIVEKISTIKTLQAIEDANIVLLVIDAHINISNQDLSLLNFILESGRSLIIVLNKCDGLDNEVKKRIKDALDYRIKFINFVRVHFISALYGIGINNMFESIHEAYYSSTRHQSTAMLTRIMNMASEDHQPPLVRGRRVKLKYAHVGGYNPLIIVIHGNQVKDLPNSYKRYLVNYFRKSLKVVGTPIHILFKKEENPFANKI